MYTAGVSGKCLVIFLLSAKYNLCDIVSHGMVFPRRRDKNGKCVATSCLLIYTPILFDGDD